MTHPGRQTGIVFRVTTWFGHMLVRWLNRPGYEIFRHRGEWVVFDNLQEVARYPTYSQAVDHIKGRGSHRAYPSMRQTEKNGV